MGSLLLPVSILVGRESISYRTSLSPQISGDRATKTDMESVNWFDDGVSVVKPSKLMKVYAADTPFKVVMRQGSVKVKVAF